MGRVWHAVNTATGRSVAVKVLDAGRVEKKSSIAAFRAEVRAMAGLNNPHIIWVHDQGTVDRKAARSLTGEFREGAPWFAMELAEHGTLKTRFARMDWRMLRSTLADLLSALAHAHANGVIHRDIKPANVLFGGDKPGLKLTDFGLAYALQRDADMDSLSKVQGGTPAYMAPEQCLSQVADIGPWSDLYSVGCLAWRAACNRNPYYGKSVFAVIDGHLNRPIPRLTPRFPVPAGLEGWIRELMHKDPSWRFQWAAEARHQLLALGQPIERSCEADGNSRVLKPISSGGLTTMLFDGDSHKRTTSYDAPHPRPLDHRPPSPVPTRWQDGRPGRRAADLRLFGLREIPLVGRKPERSHLWDALLETHETTEPRAVILSGPAGSGKSRLAEWIYRRAHEVGAATVFRAVHNPEGGRGDGIVGLLTRGLAIAGLRRERAVEQIQKILKRLGHGDPTEVDRLTQLLVPATDGDETVRFRNDAERHEVGRRLLSWISGRRPLVLWLDDVQWGLESIEFANRIMEAKPFGVLCVLTVRDDALSERDLEAKALDKLSEIDGCSLLSIDSIRSEHRVDLVRAILPVERGLAEQVAARTDGNPLFAVHLIGDWAERGALERSDDGYRLVDGAVSDLPEDLRAMWTDRVARAIGDRGDRWLRPLEVAAVLGRVVDEEEWKISCSHAGVAPRADAVGALLTERLAVRSTTGWAFVHGMLREAIAEQARANGRWKELHRACAEMLRERGGHGVPARLGVHLLEAGDPAAALEPINEGIRQHFVAGAYGLAERLLDTWYVALRAVDPPASDPRWGRGWIQRLHLHYSRGEFESAKALTGKVIAEAQRFGWAEHEIRAVVMAAHERIGWGPDTDENWGLDHALELAHKLNNPLLTARVRYQLGVEAANEGAIDDARGLLAEAIETYESLGEDWHAMMGWIHVAYVELQDANHEQALQLLQRAKTQAEDLGSGYGLAQVFSMMGEVCRQLGDLTAAESHYERCYQINKDIGNISAQLARINVGLTRVERGDWDGARLLLLKALTRTRKTLYVVAAHLGLLVCAAEDDDPAAWRESMDLLQEWGTYGRADTDFAHMTELAAKTALEAGHPDRAREAWAFAAEQMRRLGRHDDVARIRDSSP